MSAERKMRDVMVVGLVALLVATLGLLREGMSVTGALGSGVPIAIAIGTALASGGRQGPGRTRG